MTVDAPVSPSLNPAKREAERGLDPLVRSGPRHVDLQHARKARDQRIAVLIAAEKAAHHMRGLPAAAKDDPGQSATLGRSDQAVGTDRAQVGRAAQHMRVVARQQHRLAGAHFHGILPGHLQPPVAIDGIVIGDHLDGIGEVGAAIR
jgi:hypothetical protein